MSRPVGGVVEPAEMFDFRVDLSSSSFHIMPNINKLMILAYEERMLRVLFVVKSESM